MGQSSGKFIVPHIHAVKTEEGTGNAAPMETASQLVNGDASAMSNVPAIDDVVEPTSETPMAEEIQAVDNGNGPNGTLHTAKEGDGDKLERKKSNPLNWIKRRLSKKSKTSVTEEEEQGTQPPTTDAEEEMKKKAQSLVDEAILEAVADQEQMNPEVQTPNPETIPESTEEEKTELPHMESTVASTVHDEAPAEPPVETPETPQAEEPEEEEVPVVDTNNTNVAEDFDYTQETVMSKLDELEITNGYPEENVPKENGVEGEHSEVAVNGE